MQATRLDAILILAPKVCAYVSGHIGWRGETNRKVETWNRDTFSCDGKSGLRVSLCRKTGEEEASVEIVVAMDV